MNDKIDFNNINNLENLANDAINQGMESVRDDAKKKLEVYKTYIEIKRNKYLFWNAVLLSIIAATNLLFQVFKFFWYGN